MIQLVVGILGIIMGFFGLFTNLYILLILVLHKKTRSSSEWILIHLSSCGVSVSFSNIIFISPSIIWDGWITSKFPYCHLIGVFTLFIQFLTIWCICALSTDRCAAIVSPLRYTQVVTRKRLLAYFLTVWSLCIASIIMGFCFTIFPDQSGFNTSGLIDKNIESLQLSHNNDQVLFPTPPVQIDEYLDEISTNFPFIQIFDLTFNPDENHFQLPYDSGSLPSSFYSTEIETSSPSTDISRIDLDLSTSSSIIRSDYSLIFEFRPILGICLPQVKRFTWQSIIWTSTWISLTLIGPMFTILICDCIVLSIARRQRHRIVMALYQITLSAQATVTRNKGTAAPPNLWINRTVPAKSRACRAVWEDLGSIFILNLPILLITVIETVIGDEIGGLAGEFVHSIGSVAVFISPIYNALFYGIRARPIRATVRSYMRKRMTNSTLQQEIQQRLSPVDGSPRPSSRAKSFRSSTPSPNSSISGTPRRLSTNDLRPPPFHSFLTSSPSHGHLGRQSPRGLCLETGSMNVKTRKVRSFLHIPTQVDMQEFWSGLRKPQRSPTIVITHEIRPKESIHSFVSSSSSPLTTNAEHIL